MKILALCILSSLLIAFSSASADRSRGDPNAPSPTPVPSAPPVDDPIVAAAGDIADCRKGSDYQTAAILDELFPPNAPPERGIVAALGDNAYNTGSLQDYHRCYAPTWGLHRSRTRPVPGNHDYDTPGAAGYFEYFGTQAGPDNLGYYSYELGAWHVVALNSNCVVIGNGCAPDSPQQRWLRQDLAAHPAACTLAYWHHPRFSTGTKHGNDKAMREMWRTLMAFGVDVVLSGHEHDYERLAPVDQDGALDERGIREFVVGTGGHGLYPLGAPVAADEARDNTSYGVLKLTLHANSYEWQFLPATGAFTDLGEAVCH